MATEAVAAHATRRVPRGFGHRSRPGRGRRRASAQRSAGVRRADLRRKKRWVRLRVGCGNAVRHAARLYSWMRPGGRLSCAVAHGGIDARGVRQVPHYEADFPLGRFPDMRTNRVALAGRSIAWRAAQTSLDFAALFERWDRRLLGASVGSRLSPNGTSGACSSLLTALSKWDTSNRSQNAKF
jgi:hypothetical protein